MAVALVTGASRGIGKAIAVHLARGGYDGAVLARTVRDGEAREHSSTVRASDTTPLPGSLAATAALVEAAGVKCLSVPGDLTDRASVVAAATASTSPPSAMRPTTLCHGAVSGSVPRRVCPIGRPPSIKGPQFEAILGPVWRGTRPPQAR